MGPFKTLAIAATLAFSASAFAQDEPPVDDFPTNPIHGLVGCTSDGTLATLFFQFEMDTMYLHKRGLEGYRQLQNELKSNVTTTLLPEWTRIVGKYTSDDMRQEKAHPESEMYQIVRDNLAQYGETEDHEENVFAIIRGAGFSPGKDICPAHP